MKNGISGGVSLNIPAPSGGVTSGVPAVIGTVVGLPATTAAVGELFAFHVEGEYELAAESGVAFAVGDVLYWDAGNSRLTKTASGNTKIGFASKAKASASVLGAVKLER